jgi:hypothetical protein
MKDAEFHVFLAGKFIAFDISYFGFDFYAELLACAYEKRVHFYSLDLLR